jgi:pseudouridine synthase
MRQGIWYEGERLRVDSAKIVRHLGAIGRKHHWNEAGNGECWLRLVLHEGKKREIRHLCGAVGHPVKRLIRVRIGSLELGGLEVGKWRDLSQAEIGRLENNPRNAKN